MSNIQQDMLFKLHEIFDGKPLAEIMPLCIGATISAGQSLGLTPDELIAIFTLMVRNSPTLAIAKAQESAAVLN